MSSKSDIVKAPKGMNDIVPSASDAFLDSAVWDRILSVAGRVLSSYGYQRVHLPAVEQTQPFTRGIGEDTDIVSKEMYTFEDRGGRSLTLRPEGTAGAARAYVEHNFTNKESVQRWWYAGPMYRAERPQKGRYRQFYQIGAELFGVGTALADAEMLIMLWTMARELGLEDVALRINTLGDDESRARYRDALRSYLHEREDTLSEHSRSLIDKNPLRVLDSKRPEDKEVVAAAPDILDVLTDEARNHFETMTAYLDAADIPYDRDRRLVRGLDYYTGPIFEFTTGKLGAQDAVLGGGRYDHLVQELGGPVTPAVGFAAGVERLALILTQEGAEQAGPDLYIVPMTGTEARALSLSKECRAASDVVVEVDVSAGKMKQQMRRADRIGARYVLVLGETEVETGKAKLKNMRGDERVEVTLTAAELVKALQV